MNRKGATIKETFFIIVLGIGIFGALFFFITANTSDSGVALPSEYNQSFSRLSAVQGSVDNTTTDLRTAIEGVSEAKIGDFAYFGLRGMIGVLKAPLQILTTANLGLNIVFDTVGVVPTFLKTTITILLAIVIIFAIAAFFSQRFREP